MEEPKIVLNMIVRNCADYIVKALDSTLGHVDNYVIGFGGESDDADIFIAAAHIQQPGEPGVGDGRYE